MRKWIVRGLVFFCLGGMLAVGGLYQLMTNPEAVRRQVLKRLQTDLLDVEASVESARLRLFGGIDVRDIRLARKGDLDRTDFLYIPSATIYHDKEQVLESGLRIRKVEIRNPRMRIVREVDGHWNLSNLFGPTDLSRRQPTVIIHQGTLSIEDRQATPGTPPIEIHDLSLTLVNDPLPVVTFEGSGVCQGAGRIKLRGQGERGGGPIHLTIDAPELSIGPELVQRLAGYSPEAATHLSQFSARGSLHVSMSHDARRQPPVSYSVRGELTEGDFQHPRLPRPLHNLSASFRCTDGLMPKATLNATSGDTRIAATLSDVRLDAPPTTPWTDRAGSLDLNVEHYPINADLFRYLPASLQSMQQEYAPVGLGSLALNLKHIGPGVWKQAGVFRAEGMNGVYAGFRYPAGKVYGTIEWNMTTEVNPPPGSIGRTEDWIALDLKGELSGQPAFLKGRLEGQKGVAAVHLDIWGSNLPMDNQLIQALPMRSQRAVRHFHPSGKIDYRVFLRRERGQTEINKRFLLYLHEGTVCYDVFPLPLEEVSGTLDLRQDSWEFRDFVGKHNGGLVRASGRSRTMPGGPIVQKWQTTSDAVLQAAYATDAPEAGAPPSRVSVIIQGENLPIDSDFRKALAPGREALARAFDTFSLTGRLNFSAQIDDLPNQPRDIDVTVKIGGCRINPAFFLYPMEDVSATVRYARNNVWLTGFQGRHGSNVLRVNQANVCMPNDGGFWARLDRLESAALTVDGDLQRALPPALGKLMKTLHFDRPIQLSTQLIVRQPPAEGARPAVYWDATMKLADSTLQAGVEISHVTGTICTQGLHNGQQVEDVVGNAFLEHATVLNQPLRNVQLPLVIWKETPDILRLPDVKAELFGGMIGGEARVEFGSIFRYELVLNASRVQLEQLGTHNFGRSAELSGLANAGIYLIGEGTELEGMKGHGRLDVPTGKMYRLPLLLDLLKWLGLRLPDRTAFEQAHMDFRIEGPRLHVNEIDLYGNAISVRGQGSMNLDGTDLKLDLNADWGRLSQLLPSGVNDLSRELSNQLLRVKVRGKVSELKFEQELVPVVTDPLKRLWHGLVPEKKVAKEQGDRMMK